MDFGIWVSFLFGLVVGSFLNVCIHRVPKGESLWKPRSHCPLCGQPIPFHRNIPVLSFLILRGRCAQCEGKISVAYPLVELVTGVLAVAIYSIHGLNLTASVRFLVLCLLLVISVIDFNLRTIPDVLTLPGIVLSVVASPFLPSKTIVQSLLGILVGGGILWIVAWVYERITGVQGMGGGDVKLLSLIGGVLGWWQVPVVLFVASLSGSVYGLFLMVRLGVGAKHALPFGPFLCAATVLILFLGRVGLRWPLLE